MSRARLLLVLLLACTALAACAQPAASRGDLDPLFRGSAGSGEHEFDPATLPRPRRAPEAAPDAPPACEHVWESDDRATHAYVDRLTGLPALCTPIRCRLCGEVRHECQRRGR